MHRHFLEQYFRRARYDYGAIEDDSYIHNNFGYHLYKVMMKELLCWMLPLYAFTRTLSQSEQFNLFPSVYLNLSFVESMLKASGPVDLLNDYKKYERHIMGLVREAGKEDKRTMSLNLLEL